MLTIETSILVAAAVVHNRLIARGELLMVLMFVPRRWCGKQVLLIRRGKIQSGVIYRMVGRGERWGRQSGG